MPQHLTDDTPLHLAPGVSLQAPSGEGYTITWGRGSAREYFTTDSAALAGLLAAMPETTTVASAQQRLTSGLATSPAAASELIGHLVDYGYWLGEPAALTDGERAWLAVDWEEALDYHLATSDMIWTHDYSGDPQVMTRHLVDQNVQPDTPRPTRWQPAVSDFVTLPEPTKPAGDYWAAHGRRRTAREFRGTSLALEDLATVLGLAFKPQFPAGRPYLYTTQSYSLGAPFHAFVITGATGAPAELRPGFAVYHYDAEQHRLGLVKHSTPIDQLDALMWRQSYVNDAPAMLVICVDWHQYMWKYRFPRAYRFALTECGAFMHTVLLLGAALGLRTFATPAIDDAAMSQALAVNDVDHSPLYMATLGRPV